VIRTILEVARRFPVIRFDAAMVLAKKHIERLWWPEPGHGGAIPSRSEHAMTRAEFERLMPHEFWREVVDRVAAEAPDTLLLAEAFWLLEGYFVRTLGMHRVYNSAFMHMLRDEDNAGYRKVIRDTIEFDPEILKRYVNFMTNPDEETAIDQFGTGDKYFGVATLLATMPGLPMVGHGQVEGFTEKYGMEFQRAQRDEQPNEGLIARFEREIVPLLHERRRYAGAADFRLYDVIADGGAALDDVFAYTNGRGADRSLVVYHNRFASVAGWVHDAVPFAVKADDGSKTAGRATLAEALEVTPDDGAFVAFREARSGLEYLRSARELSERGLLVELDAYRAFVFGSFRELRVTADARWSELAGELGGRGVSSLDDALADLRLRPVHDRVRAAVTSTDPAAVALALATIVEDVTRVRFDELRLATPLGRAGLDDDRIRRTRLAIGLAHPKTTPDPAVLAGAWLADPEIAAFLEVHDWEGATYLNGDRWIEVVDLAAAMDRAAGARRASPVIARLRAAAPAAGYRLDRLLASLGAVAPATSDRPKARAPRTTPSRRR
jgi:hypothetical protein